MIDGIKNKNLFTTKLRLFEVHRFGTTKCGIFSLIPYSFGIFCLLQGTGFGSHFWAPISFWVHLKSFQIIFPRLRISIRVIVKTYFVIIFVVFWHDSPAIQATNELKWNSSTERMYCESLWCVLKVVSRKTAYLPALPSLKFSFSFPMFFAQALIMLHRKLVGASVLIPCWTNGIVRNILLHQSCAREQLRRLGARVPLYLSSTMSVCRIIMALNPKCLLCFLPNQNLNNKFHLGRIVTISLGLNCKWHDRK